jgi:glutamine synthetase
VSNNSQNNILLEYDFEFVSYKSIDLLGRMTEQDMPFRQFCNTKEEPKYYRYFADPFRNLPTLNIFKSCETHDIAIQVDSLLKVKKIELELELSIDFFIFDDLKDLEDRVLHDANDVNHKYLKHDYQKIDSLSNIRSEIVSHLEKLGIQVLKHFNSDNSNKCSITFVGMNFIDAVNNFLVAKYLIKNVVASYGKFATFMPKPNSLQQNSITALIALDGINTKNFALSIGQNIKALTAFTNPTYNGFKKLLLHKELSNIKIIDLKKNIQKIELNFVDCIANPLLAFSAIILAGLSFDSENQSKVDTDERCIQLHFAENLTDSLRIIQQDLKFYYNIFDSTFLNNYVNFVRAKENTHNLHISSCEIMLYYNM